MISLTWARLFHADRPDTAAVFTDRRDTARVLVSAPEPHPCGGCGVDTGSEDVDFCCDKCQMDWHYQQLQTANNTADTAAGGQP